MHIDHHSPGSFCWYELSTTDQSAAKEFYASLFAWQPDDIPTCPGEFYTIFKIDGRDAAAAQTMHHEQRVRGVPPNWLIYVAVHDVDASATRAAAAGATIVAPPFDLGKSGRMMVLNDPTGATLALWEPRNHHGTGVAQEPGTGVWADLSSPDPGRAIRFYHELFGWQVVAGKDMRPASPDDYGHIVNGGEFIGGVMPAAHVPKGAAPNWLVYFSVSNCADVVARTRASGGTIVMPVMTMEGARKYAVLRDPQGATFGVVESLR